MPRVSPRRNDKCHRREVCTGDEIIWTTGQTDRQTDRQTDGATCYIIIVRLYGPPDRQTDGQRELLYHYRVSAVLYAINIVSVSIYTYAPEYRYVPVSAPGGDEYTETDDVTCLPRCRGDVTFRDDDKRFAATWQTAWACLSMTSSLVAVLTFVVDSARFRYPERPVVFVAVCRCAVHICQMSIKNLCLKL